MTEWLNEECKKGFETLCTFYHDSRIRHRNEEIQICYGRLKRVVEFLMDYHVNFKVHNNTIIFNESELMMIGD